MASTSVWVLLRDSVVLQIVYMKFSEVFNTATLELRVA